MESYSEAFDPDDPTLPYRYTTYDTDTNLDEWPPMSTQQKQVHSNRKASWKQTEH